jgi:hypothetical protein
MTKEWLLVELPENMTIFLVVRKLYLCVYLNSKLNHNFYLQVTLKVGKGLLFQKKNVYGGKRPPVTKFHKFCIFLRNLDIAIFQDSLHLMITGCFSHISPHDNVLIDEALTLLNAIAESSIEKRDVSGVNQVLYLLSYKTCNNVTPIQRLIDYLVIEYRVGMLQRGVNVDGLQQLLKKKSTVHPNEEEALFQVLWHRFVSLPYKLDNFMGNNENTAEINSRTPFDPSVIRRWHSYLGHRHTLPLIRESENDELVRGEPSKHTKKVAPLDELSPQFQIHNDPDVFEAIEIISVSPSLQVRVYYFSSIVSFNKYLLWYF